MLRVPQSLGFLGGRPNHAIYFIGAQGMANIRTFFCVRVSIAGGHLSYSDGPKKYVSHFMCTRLSWLFFYNVLPRIIIVVDVETR